MKQSSLEIKAKEIFEVNGFRFESEYRFDPVRKWRFDFADTKNKIAIEIEGGTWVSGRHTRGSGFKKDTEKYNRATTLGWRLLRYTTITDLKKFFKNDYLLTLKQCQIATHSHKDIL